VRQSSNKWEGNAEYTTNTKTAGSERGPNPTVAAALAQADPNATLREAGNKYETNNNANLSGRPNLVLDLNGAAVVREVSNRW